MPGSASDVSAIPGRVTSPSRSSVAPALRGVNGSYGRNRFRWRRVGSERRAGARPVKVPRRSDMSHDPSLYPSAVTGRVGFFDRFAGKASEIVSRAPFFAFCLALVGLWLIEGIVKVVTGGPESFLGD